MPLADGTGTVLDWLRAHGRYLITGNGLSGWTLAASILSGTLLNLFVLLPVILLLIGLASGDWFEFRWPPELHMPGAGAVPAHDGFMLIAIAAWPCWRSICWPTLAFALSTVLPPLRQLSAGQYLRQRLGQLLGGGLTCIGIGLLPVLAGIEETAHHLSARRFRAGTDAASHLDRAAGHRHSCRCARPTSRASTPARSRCAGLALVLCGLFTALYHLAHHTTCWRRRRFMVWLAASVLFAFVCDINAVSMHSYYRSRLAGSFPARSGRRRRMRRQPPDAVPAHRCACRAGGPFHIINTTLNTTSSTDAKLRARNGENMILTPLYCGSSATGYRRTSNYLRGELTLSTAFSVSGAAVDPDTYATKSRAVSFLMALLNIRLGIWVANPRHEPRRFAGRPGITS